MSVYEYMRVNAVVCSVQTRALDSLEPELQALVIQLLTAAWVLETALESSARAQALNLVSI